MGDRLRKGRRRRTSRIKLIKSSLKSKTKGHKPPVKKARQISAPKVSTVKKPTRKTTAQSVVTNRAKKAARKSSLRKLSTRAAGATRTRKTAKSAKTTRRSDLRLTPKKSRKPKQALQTKRQSAKKPPLKPSLKPTRTTKSTIKIIAPRKPARRVSRASGTPIKTATRSNLVQSMMRRQKPEKTIMRRRTPSEAEALKIFEQAHKIFAQQNYRAALKLFSDLINNFDEVTEVTARARIYINIIQMRLKARKSVVENQSSHYDLGVIALNRGDLNEALEYFHQALSSHAKEKNAEEPHVLFAIAATLTRMSETQEALKTLERAIQLLPSLRSRAQHDQDFVALRADPEFERIVFSYH